MHRSRLCAVIMDCNTYELDAAAQFWSQALGRRIAAPQVGDVNKYRPLETPSGEVIVEVQSVDHASRAHIDIETDDMDAEVERLEKLGAKFVKRFPRWVVMRAPTGQRFCVVNRQSSDFDRQANRWD